MGKASILKLLEYEANLLEVFFRSIYKNNFILSIYIEAKSLGSALERLNRYNNYLKNLK